MISIYGLICKIVRDLRAVVTVENRIRGQAIKGLSY